MPTLRTLFKAPVTSPLSKVDVWNVASLMLRLTEAASLLSNRTTQGMSPAALDPADPENRATNVEEEGEDEEKENEATPSSADKSKASSTLTKTPNSVLTKLVSEGFFSALIASAFNVRWCRATTVDICFFNSAHDWAVQSMRSFVGLSQFTM